MPGNGDTPTVARQPVSLADEATDLDFARDLVELFGAGGLVATGRYFIDGRSHVELRGPLPRGWRGMIPARVRHQGTPRIGWRNSRGDRLHAVDFSMICELSGELAVQRSARGAQ